MAASDARGSRPLLTLASRSERRRELLLRLRRGFDWRPARSVVETAVAGAAREVVRRLALLKASEVLARVLDDAATLRDHEPWVLGADTVIALEVDGDERIMGKPTGPRDAMRMLESLSGRSHKVYTGLAVCRPDRRPETAVETTVVRFHPLSAGLIDAYVGTGEPLDKAGAYGIQGEGARLIEGIEGCYYNVVGLPLSLTARLLGPLVGPDARLCDCAAHPLQRGVPRCSQEGVERREKEEGVKE